MVEKKMYTPYRWLMAGAASFAIISLYIDMIAFSPILGEIAQNLDIDMGAATNLMMGFILAIALVMSWAGVVTDKWGVLTAAIIGLLLGSVPAALMPVIGNSFALIFIGRLLQGAGVGILLGIMGPITALWFPPDQQGLAGGIMFGGIPLGSAIGVVISPAIYAGTGSWQVTIALMSLFGWAAIIIAVIVFRRKPSQEVVNMVIEIVKKTQGDMTLKKAFKMPVTWVMTFVVFLNTWGLYGLYNMVPPYLAAPEPMGVGLGPGVAGWVSISVTAIGFPGTIIGGILFNKVFKANPKPNFFIGFLFTAICAFLILQPGIYSSMVALVLSLLIVGFVMPAMAPPINGFIAMTYPPAMVGRMVGWFFGFGTFGGALALFLGGRSIAASGNYFYAIFMITLAAVVGFVLSFFVKIKKRED